MSEIERYDVLVADFFGPVKLVPGTAAAPAFVPARNALGPAMSASALELGPSLWVFPPSSPEEEDAAVVLQQRPMEGIETATTDFTILDIDAETRAGHQRTFAHSLWPVFSLPVEEAIRVAVPPTSADWAAYQVLNSEFALCIAAHAALSARVMVRDLELLLLPGMLRELRPDLSISFFSFAPWSTASAFRSLPSVVLDAVADSLATVDDAGLLSNGSVRRFDETMRAIRPAAAIEVSAYPLPIDSEEIAEKAFSSATQHVVDRLQHEYSSMRVIARAERAERPANLLGGLEALRRLLELHPQWQGRIVHLNAIFPGSLDSSGQEMLARASALADEINAALGTSSWRPIEFTADVDYLRSLALMRVADVYVATPTLESMSITTWEAVELNERSAAFVMSSISGTAELFGDEAIVVDAFDIDGTAHALHESLLLSEDIRRERLRRMRDAVRTSSPTAWFAAQLSPDDQTSVRQSLASDA